MLKRILRAETPMETEENSTTRSVISGFTLHGIAYIIEPNPHPFYSFRGLNNQMRIRFAVVSWILEK